MLNRTTAQEMIVVEIDQVDLTTRVAHVFDKTRAPIQVSFRQAPGGIFHIPVRGEMWTAKRVGVQWYLDQKLDTLADHRWAVEHMQAGDTRIDALATLFLLTPTVSLNGRDFGATVNEVFESLVDPFLTVTLTHTPVSDGSIQVFENGALMLPSEYSRAGKVITFLVETSTGHMVVYYQTTEAP